MVRPLFFCIFVFVSFLKLSAAGFQPEIGSELSQDAIAMLKQLKVEKTSIASIEGRMHIQGSFCFTSKNINFFGKFLLFSFQFLLGPTTFPKALELTFVKGGRGWLQKSRDIGLSLNYTVKEDSRCLFLNNACPFTYNRNHWPASIRSIFFFLIWIQILFKKNES